MNERDASILREPILDREHLRELDRRAVSDLGMTSLVLMENAARSALEVFLRLKPQGPIAIVCGRGNNAGDGFALSRLLDGVGLPVTLHLLDRPDMFSSDAAVNYDIARRAGLAIESHVPFESSRFAAALAASEWIIDAILGTGARGEPREPYAAAIARMNAAPARRFALDLPSGLDCDTGIPAKNTIRADLTIAFAALKPGFSTPAARAYLGEVHCGSIGLPRAFLASAVADYAKESTPPRPL